VIVVERAISLSQPWASLVANGAKQYETRSWRTHYRGWLAIHAAKRFPRECRALFSGTMFQLALKDYSCAEDLPCGGVIAIAKLVDCVSTDLWKPSIGSSEWDFGDYSGGRFAWKLEHARTITAFEIKGAPGIWRLPTPFSISEGSEGEYLWRTALNPAAAWPFPPGARKP
jgi:hypothetical protein